MTRPRFSSGDFQLHTNVSRETLSQFETYAELLTKWQRSINLVGPETLSDVWRRHFYDSAQLLPFLSASGPLIDLGSGAGFPGLVLALLGRDHVTMIESNGKKCAFLREMARSTGATVTIVQARIEAATDLPKARWVTSRALAPLDKLLSHANPHLVPGGKCVFLKGRQADAELTAARKKWKMRVEKSPSLTDEEGIVLTIGDLEQRHDQPLAE